jgi:hypothetical protein
MWHLLKGYLASKLPDWDSLPSDQRDQIILATGTTFIMEQLPVGLQWLAGPIAQATVLRSIRLKSVAELMRLMAHPASAEVWTTSSGITASSNICGIWKSPSNS